MSHLPSNSPVSIIALRVLPIFETLNDERLEEIARIASLRSVVRNSTIIRAGDRTDNIYLVLAGARSRCRSATRMGAR